MSDIDGENEHTPFTEGMFIPVSANEIIQQQKAVRDRMNMAHREYQQSVFRFLEELSPEHLYTFNRILTNIINLGDDGRDTCNWLSGQSAAILRIVHRVCSNCGNRDHTDHDSFMSEIVGMSGDLDGKANPGTEEL